MNEKLIAVPKYYPAVLTIAAFAAGIAIGLFAPYILPYWKIPVCIGMIALYGRRLFRHKNLDKRRKIVYSIKRGDCPSTQ